MITIHKYGLHFGVGVEMPKDAKILSVQWQDGHVYAWAQVDTEKPVELRYFTVVATGGTILSNDVKFMNYLSTLQEGRFVWHIFEVKQ